jgi:hypothetical protein
MWQSPIEMDQPSIGSRGQTAGAASCTLESRLWAHSRVFGYIARPLKTAGTTASWKGLPILQDII